MNLYIAVGLLVAVCSTCVAGHCRWGPWGSWESCSVTCGHGVQYRYRKCEGSSYCDPNDCSYGSNKELRTCELHPCCTMKYTWGSWGRCKRCYRKRTRHCEIPPHCYGSCGTPKIEKEKCGGCEWKKTRKYGPCEKADYGKCVKMVKYKCRCKGCKGSCAGDPPTSYKDCNPDECCKCNWILNGYSDCAIGKHGKCEKYAKYSCLCYPAGCGLCDGPKPSKTVTCPSSECCYWKSDGYTDCAKGKNGKCEKHEKYSCHCHPSGCGSCGGYKPSKTVTCPSSECCKCYWKSYGYTDCAKGKNGKCEKHEKYSCHCHPSGCGSCSGYKPSKTVTCPSSECCKCYWKSDGYTDCAKGKNGKCEKHEKYSCHCYPPRCGSCSGYKPSKTVTCPSSECCKCYWKSDGYSHCATAYHGKCEKHEKYSCHCHPSGCGSCSGYNPSKTVTCPSSECCQCEWSPWGACKKVGYICQRTRHCNCPYGCTGDCHGKSEEHCPC